MNIKLTSVLFFLATGLASCGMRATSLGDHSTSIPKNPKAYRNRVKFNAEVLKYIDTSVVYERIGYLNHLKKDSFVSYSEEQGHDFHNFYRFFSNGFMNEFFILRNTPLTPKQFDPTYTGYRGIYYMKKGRIKGELFAPVNQLYQMGKLKFTFTIKGDTLLLSTGKGDWYPNLYIKRKLPPEYMGYKIPG